MVVQRENAIINRLNKTKVEKHPDLKQEKDDRLRELRKRDQATQQVRKKAEDKQKKEWEQKKREKESAYDAWNDDDAMAEASNQNRDEDWEDDFM